MPDRTTQTDGSWINGHTQLAYASNLGRGNTAASVLFTIPARSTIIGLQISGTKSNASISARISIGSSGGAGNDFLSDYDVKGSGNVSIPSSTLLGFFNDPNPIQVTGTYAETGSASNAGGPWLIVMETI